jgi:hypothetical protein
MDGEPGDFTVSEGQGHPLVPFEMWKTQYRPQAGISNLEGSIFRPFSNTESPDKICLDKDHQLASECEGDFKGDLSNGAHCSKTMILIPV